MSNQKDLTSDKSKRARFDEEDDTIYEASQGSSAKRPLTPMKMIDNSHYLFSKDIEL